MLKDYLSAESREQQKVLLNSLTDNLIAQSLRAGKEAKTQEEEEAACIDAEAYLGVSVIPWDKKTICSPITVDEFFSPKKKPGVIPSGI